MISPSPPPLHVETFATREEMRAYIEGFAERREAAALDRAKRLYVDDRVTLDEFERAVAAILRWER